MEQFENEADDEPTSSVFLSPDGTLGLDFDYAAVALLVLVCGLLELPKQLLKQ